MTGEPRPPVQRAPVTWREWGLWLKVARARGLGFQKGGSNVTNQSSVSDWVVQVPLWPSGLGVGLRSERPGVRSQHGPLHMCRTYQKYATIFYIGFPCGLISVDFAHVVKGYNTAIGTLNGNHNPQTASFGTRTLEKHVPQAYTAPAPNIN